MFKQKIKFRITLTIIIILSFTLTCYAADATWSYKYTTPDQLTGFNDVIPVSSGGYLAVGSATDNNIDNLKNAFITRLDANLQVLWQKSFTFAVGQEDELYSVVESPDGGFITAGRTCTKADPIRAALILKIDSNGNLLWNKLFKGHCCDSNYAARIKATRDGNYVVVGKAMIHHRNEQDVIDWSATGGMITKISGAGQIIFSRSFCGDWTHSYNWNFADVVQDSSGAYYATGSAGTEAYSEGIGGSGLLLCKISPVGDLVWAKKFDYALDETAQFIDDHGHRILLSGNTLYVTGILGTGRQWLWHPFTMHSFTLSGSRNWSKQYYYNNGNGTSGTNDFIESGDGNFFIATAQATKILTKISPQGEIIWAKAPIDYSWNPASLSLETDNGLLVGGGFYDASVGTVATITKYDSNGDSCSKPSLVPDLGSATIEMLSNSLPYNSVILTADSDEISVFSSPILSVEKYCGAVAQMTVYMPHLTGTIDNQPEWSDFLEVDNYSNENAEINIILYDENGTKLYDGGLTIPALENDAIDLKALAGNARCGKVIYDNPKINFRLAYENNLGGGVAEFKLSNEIDDNLGFYFSDFTPAIVWKGMALCNWGGVTANISLKAQGGGVEYNGPTLSIAPNSKIVGTFGTWFPSLNFNQVKRVFVTSDQPTLNGITISGDASCSLLLFTSAAPTN